MRILAALGGNALLRRGDEPTAAAQRARVRAAAKPLATIAGGNELVITHGNGPQVGLLALQGGSAAYPIDVLDAETEGQIGYMIEQELGNLLPADRHCAALLTQIVVDGDDPAFDAPTKPIGPVCDRADADALTGSRGWRFAPVDGGFRRVVPSPAPRRMVEIRVVELLLRHNVVVICAGGGGIPVVDTGDGMLAGVEAVIDKDAASALVARETAADALPLLTDVDAVHDRWGASDARRIRRISPEDVRRFHFAEGSMGPKIEAACAFVEATGAIAGIGALEDAGAILAGTAGTQIARYAETLWWDAPGPQGGNRSG